MTSHNTGDIDVGDWVSRLLGRWKVLFVAGLLGAVAGYGISRLLPKTYESKATIYVQQNESAMGLLRNLPKELSSQQGTISGYIVTLLGSDTMLKRLVRTLHLAGSPAFGGSKDEEVLTTKLRGSIFVSEDKNGSIRIVTRAGSPQLAADIANAMLDNLSSLVMTRSKRKAFFISDRLKETDRKLRESEERLRRFEESNGVVAIDDETKGMLEHLAVLDEKLVEANINLQNAKSALANAGDLNELVKTDVRRRAYEASTAYLTARIRELQDRLARTPNVGMQFVRLMRDVTVLSKTYELLTEQYQLAMISQHGEDGDYQVVDRASPRKRPVLPRAVLNAGIGGLLSMFACAMIFVSTAGTAGGRRALR